MLTFPFGGHIETYSDPSGSFHCHVAFTLWKVSWYKASSIAHCRVCPNTGYSEIPQDLFRIECSMRNGPWWILQKLPYKYIYILLIYIIYIYTLHLNTISNVASFFGDTPATEPFDHIGPTLGGQTCCGALHCRPCCGTGGSMDSPGKNGNAWDSPGNCGKSRKLIDIDMQKKTTTVSYWIATWWFPMGFPYLCLFNQG